MCPCVNVNTPVQIRSTMLASAVLDVKVGFRGKINQKLNLISPFKLKHLQLGRKNTQLFLSDAQMKLGEPPDTGHPHPISHDKDSCPFRDCHRDISCPNGFRLDKSGCPTCECQKCQSLLGCKLSCSKGFKVDTFGCTLCDCRGSEDNNLIFPPFSSSSSRSRSENNIEANHHEISSPSGSLDQSSSSSIFSGGKLDQRNLLGNSGSNNNNKDLFGRDGHQYHHQYHDGNRYHRPHPHQHTHHNVVDNGNDDDDGSYNYGYDSNEARSSSSLASGGGGSGASTSVLVVLCTVDSDGVRRMEGEEWSDHCRRCVCRNGKEMCSLITCQVNGNNVATINELLMEFLRHRSIFMNDVIYVFHINYRPQNASIPSFILETAALDVQVLLQPPSQKLLLLVFFLSLSSFFQLLVCCHSAFWKRLKIPRLPIIMHYTSLLPLRSLLVFFTVHVLQLHQVLFTVNVTVT